MPNNLNKSIMFLRLINVVYSIKEHCSFPCEEAVRFLFYSAAGAGKQLSFNVAEVQSRPAVKYQNPIGPSNHLAFVDISNGLRFISFHRAEADCPVFIPSVKWLNRSVDRDVEPGNIRNPITDEGDQRARFKLRLCCRSPAVQSPPGPSALKLLKETCGYIKPSAAKWTISAIVSRELMATGQQRSG
ncbi:hypothetical protein HPP92_015902 [Vanilla planifolia]|uniref:Uncharacterized protein n=1 Tax=Vanilla planifolia TaxID=51239 RepID=A0A835UTP7_VANPL|nr:hypothetical protein HPP92_016492 [Vanilla planifolia]KAG0471356.1 hypothetical protein HPP92_015902 [Vanilla planifolia]